MEQEKIWSYFQDEGAAHFDASEPRYKFLVNQVVSHSQKEGGKVLNIGAGGGGVERGLLSKGWSVFTLDPDHAMVAKLAQFGITAKQGFAQEIPFTSDTFDVVVISEVLEHIEDAQRAIALSEIRRVLKQNGLMIGTVPYQEILLDSKTVCPQCGNVFHRWGHVAAFDRAKFGEEVKFGFEILTLHPTSFPNWGRVKGIRGLLKELFKTILGRMGEGVVSPSLYFKLRVKKY